LQHRALIFQHDLLQPLDLRNGAGDRVADENSECNARPSQKGGFPPRSGLDRHPIGKEGRLLMAAGGGALGLRAAIVFQLE
jgi:hypothetical protein